ncbi:response regulator [Erythrobacter sp. NE805]|uniref:response regulator n=1 Tax=Erythrobacter sp. NE805 TaxID=3389875 RepID=UPI00396B321F
MDPAYPAAARDAAAAPAERILVVDDDEAIRRLVSASLTRHGYEASAAADVAEAERMLAARSYDVVILDVMMPGEDGLSFCRRIAGPDAPMILILSALDASSDRTVGLEVGADAYCPKPCEPRELVATVRALLRRSRRAVDEGPQTGRILEFGTWQFDLVDRALRTSEGERIELSASEFSLLRSFVSMPRRVLTRDQLLDSAYGSGVDVFDRAVDVQVSRLRRKFGAEGASVIRTVRNGGYMFTLPVVRR